MWEGIKTFFGVFALVLPAVIAIMLILKGMWIGYIVAIIFIAVCIVIIRKICN